MYRPGNPQSFIHCTICHTFEYVELDGVPTWDYAVDHPDPAVHGFGLCAMCNTESYGSVPWALSVDALEEPLPCTGEFAAICQEAHERIWEM